MIAYKGGWRREMEREKKEHLGEKGNGIKGE